MSNDRQKNLHDAYEDPLTNEILIAIENRDLSALKNLVNRHPDLLLHTSTEWYAPMHHAAGLGWRDGLEVLLNAENACKFVNRFDELSFTPLIHTVREGFLDCMKLLTEYGADINAHEEARIGSPAICYAVDGDTIEIIQYLIDNRADPTIRGWMQLNAIDRAEIKYEKNPSESNKTILQILRREKKIKF